MLVNQFKLYNSPFILTAVFYRSIAVVAVRIILTADSRKYIKLMFLDQLLAVE